MTRKGIPMLPDGRRLAERREADPILEADLIIRCDGVLKFDRLPVRELRRVGWAGVAGSTMAVLVCMVGATTVLVVVSASASAVAATAVVAAVVLAVNATSAPLPFPLKKA